MILMNIIISSCSSSIRNDKSNDRDISCSDKPMINNGNNSKKIGHNRKKFHDYKNDAQTIMRISDNDNNNMNDNDSSDKIYERGRDKNVKNENSTEIDDKQFNVNSKKGTLMMKSVLMIIMIIMMASKVVMIVIVMLMMVMIIMIGRNRVIDSATIILGNIISVIFSYYLMIL